MCCLWAVSSSFRCHSDPMCHEVCMSPSPCWWWWRQKCETAKIVSPCPLRAIVVRIFVTGRFSADLEVVGGVLHISPSVIHPAQMYVSVIICRHRVSLGFGSSRESRNCQPLFQSLFSVTGPALCSVWVCLRSKEWPCSDVLVASFQRSGAVHNNIKQESLWHAVFIHTGYQ